MPKNLQEPVPNGHIKAQINSTHYFASIWLTLETSDAVLFNLFLLLCHYLCDFVLVKTLHIY